MDTSISHLEAIKAVVGFTEQKEAAFTVLLSSEQSSVLYTVTNEDVCHALDKVIEGNIDLDDLEMWAQLLDIRQDIDTEEVEGVLYALCNAEQMGELSLDKIKHLKSLLQ